MAHKDGSASTSCNICFLYRVTNSTSFPQVMWHPQGKENLAKSKQTDEQTEVYGITRSLQINHLKAETMYTFEVQARTKIGYGPPQSESFKTKHCK